VNLPAKSDSRVLGLVAILNPRAFDISLTARSCHENMIIK